MSPSDRANALGVRGILFDYGNTLIAYGHREDGIVTSALHDCLKEHGAPVDPVVFLETNRAVTGELIDRATETGREVRRGEKVERLLEAFDLTVTEDVVEVALTAISQAFVFAIESSEELVPRLERLAARFQIGLLSNYYLAEPIHESLRKIRIEPLLDPLVVSADIGWCKPHEKAFMPALSAFPMDPSEVLMVGDNLTADIFGAAAVGMRTAHTREFLDGALPYGTPEGRGVTPDITVESLAELETLLLGE
jgi:HAD superfamily hydrolase (TIGR01549 family)